MKLDHTDVDTTLDQVKSLLKQEKGLSPALRSALEVLLVLVSVVIGRLGTNSRNSSQPPSSDPNRQKVSRKGKSNKRPEGQKGYVGVTLVPVDDPDEVIALSIDQRTLDKNTSYQSVGVEKRQIIDIDIQRFVTEYQAQVLEDDKGNRFVATFPDHVKKSVQYGLTIKAQAFTVVVQRKPLKGQADLDAPQSDEEICEQGYVYRAIATNRESMTDSEIIH